MSSGTTGYQVRQAMQDHPYVHESGENGLAAQLLDMDYSYDGMRQLQSHMLEAHQSKPVDAMIGDDVSGRVPTLITRQFMKYAHAAGHIETLPRTFFMASGKSGFIESREHEQREAWSKNLTDHARKLIAVYGLQRVMFITEVVSSGTSIRRLEDAFRAHGAEAKHLEASMSLYLGGHGRERTDRVATGVEKFPPEPISRKHPDFDTHKVNLQRDFISEYTRALYIAVMGEKPPSLEDYTPKYNTYPPLTNLIGILGSDERNAKRAAIRSRSAWARSRRQLP